MCYTTCPQVCSGISLLSLCVRSLAIIALSCYLRGSVHVNDLQGSSLLTAFFSVFLAVLSCLYSHKNFGVSVRSSLKTKKRTTLLVSLLVLH